MLLKEIEKIIRLVEKSEIAELEWEKNKERIRVRKNLNEVQAQVLSYAPPAVAAAALSAAVPARTAEATPVVKTETARGKEVLSPFVGTFFASPSPGSAKYCDLGQRVKKGDVLCIIEAM